MSQFIAALLTFLALHIIPAIPGLRARLVGAIGRRAYLVIYSLISLLALAWLFHATLKLDFIELWAPAAWQAWLPVLLTPVGLFFLLAGLFSPNPISISLRQPDLAPGAITTITRHPVLWGFALWAGSHLVPNGDLRSLLLFGVLLAFAVLGMFTTDRRAQRRLAAQWTSIAESTSMLPFEALVAGRTHWRVDRPMVAALVVSALLTGWLLLGGHAMMFGADPLTMLSI